MYGFILGRSERLLTILLDIIILVGLDYLQGIFYQMGVYSIPGVHITNIRGVCDHITDGVV